jgi:hypothetical protein
MLQQALASRRLAIEHTSIEQSPVALAPSSRSGEPTPSRVIVSWPYHAPDAQPGTRAIPQVDGQPVREATLALHRSGFRVSLKGLGRVSRTVPSPGEPARTGSTVLVWAE